jgi:hypothetical protein
MDTLPAIAERVRHLEMKRDSVDPYVSNNSVYDRISRRLAALEATLVAKTAATDPLDGTAGSRPPGKAGEIVYYATDLYVCVDASTPVWEKIGGQ